MVGWCLCLHWVQRAGKRGLPSINAVSPVTGVSAWSLEAERGPLPRIPSPRGSLLSLQGLTGPPYTQNCAA